MPTGAFQGVTPAYKTGSAYISPSDLVFALDMETTASDGTLFDLSGNGRNYTIKDSTLNTSAISMFGMGRSFSSVAGSNHLEALNLPTTPTAFTIYGWIKPSDSGTQRNIMDWHFASFLLSTTGGLQYTGTASYGSGLLAGQWHNVAMTHSGTVVNFYIDGRMVGSESNTSLPTTAVSHFGWNDNAGSRWFGSMDDFMVFNRALSREEIKILANTGKKIVSRAGLLLAWDMDSLTPSGLMRDLSGNGKHGTIVGATTAEWGVVGKTRTFTIGSDQNVNVTNLITTKTNVDKLSLSIWARQIDTVSGASGRTLIVNPNQGDNPSTGYIWSYIDTNKTSLSYQWANNATGGFATTSWTSAITDNNWHHICFVANYNTTNDSLNGTVEAWVDGASLGVNSMTGTPIVAPQLNNKTTRVGSYNATTYIFQGELDEPMVWERLLTPAEIKALSNRFPVRGAVDIAGGK